MTDTRPILVGYDGRAGSHVALDEALRVGRDLGATVVVLFSFEAMRIGGEAADLDAVIDEHGRVVLADAVARAEQAGAQIETTQRAQPIIEGLLEEAEERDAQMIVVGSTGEGPLRGLIVGSTPYKLLHASTRPVLVVPSRD
jgi:nucleotide-binding universal stress UspA family protein